MLHRHSEHVWYLDRNDASDRPVIGYVKGETFSVLIDAGNSPYHAQEIIDELEKSGLPMPSYVILTHSHWDHCYGLKRLNIPAISNSITHKYLLADKERIWSNEKFREYCDKGVLEPFIAEHMAVEYDDFSAIEVIIPQIVYESEMTLHCGGVTVKSLKIPNPHSDDGSIVYIPEDVAVFMGDCFCEELTGDHWTDHPEKVKDLGKVVQDLECDTIFHAHFDMMNKTQLLQEVEKRTEK